MSSKRLFITFLALAILVIALSACGENDGNKIELSSLDHFIIDYWLDNMEGDYQHHEVSIDYTDSVFSNDEEYARAAWEKGLPFGEKYEWDSVWFYDIEDVSFIIWIDPQGYVQWFQLFFNSNSSVINAENHIKEISQYIGTEYNTLTKENSPVYRYGVYKIKVDYSTRHITIQEWGE